MAAADHSAIVLTGYAADAAAARLLEDRRGEIEQHFPSFFRVRIDSGRICPPFPEKLMDMSSRLTELPGIIGREQVRYNRKLGFGGILKGLWDLGEELQAGMEVDIKKIPIRQETVEICEFFDVDPYYADASTCFLAAVRDSESVLFHLHDAGIPASAIGFLTDEKARRIHYPGHVRYLDKPRAYL